MLSLLALVACSPDALLLDPGFATGSRTLVDTPGTGRLYTVNVDEGTVSRLDPERSTTDEIPVGSEPVRIARAGERLYVTLKGQRQVVELQDTDAGLVEVDRIDVGSEPYGIVADETGERVYVAVALEGRIVALDTSTNEPVGSWPVAGEPRWMALHPDGSTLYVANGRGLGRITVVRTDTPGVDGVLEHIGLPSTQRNTAEGRIDLSGRITGDPAVDPRGEHLVVPVLYVDNQSIEDVPAGVDPTTAYYMNPEPGIGRFNGALARLPITSGGTLGPGEAIFVAGFRETDAGLRTARSYPNSVTISDDGLFYATSLEASDAVIVVGALPYNQNVRHDGWARPADEARPDRAGFAEHPHYTLRTGAGPRGVVLRGDRAQVHTFLDLSIGPLDLADAVDAVRERGTDGIDDTRSSSTLSGGVQVAESVLPAEVRAGRRAFYQASDPTLVATDSGVSCSTCHFDTRDDGLTWQLGPDLRQTPSLAGQVSATTPVTWTQQVASVAEEARLTSTIRMGGTAVDDGTYALIASWIDHTRVPESSDRDWTDPLVQLGEEVFRRPEVGCATCHGGDAFTDNASHDLYGLQQVNTPTLRGIAATAPYLHDGSAPTLRELLERSRNGDMGDTSSLDEHEMDALEAYLRNL